MRLNEPRRTSLLRPAKSWPMPAASKAPLVGIQTVEVPLRWFATLLLATVLAVALAACSDDSTGSGESGIERQPTAKPGDSRNGEADSPPIPGSPREDLDALVALYEAFGERPGWADDAESIWDVPPEEELLGVIPDENGRIVGLLLSNSLFSGEIPPEVGSLTALRWLVAAEEREEPVFLSHPRNAVVTGAFSYTGRYVAECLLEQGVSLRTLTRNPRRDSPFGDAVKALPLDFSDPDGLRRSMKGAGVLYNTYWIRFGRGRATFDQAVENSKLLLSAAADAGVERVVHFSVANASAESRLPYFRGKGQLEEFKMIPSPSGYRTPVEGFHGGYAALKEESNEGRRQSEALLALFAGAQ